MPEPADPKRTEVVSTLAGLLLNDPVFKSAVGKRTTAFILATLAFGSVEVLYGLPVLTLATCPLAGAMTVFLISAVADWIRSGKPDVIFYLCPEEHTFVAIRWVDLPRYRKRKACPTCGSRYIVRCQRQKHFILSPDPANPNTQPTVDGYCSLCDPGLPKNQRRYLPEWANVQRPLDLRPDGK